MQRNIRYEPLWQDRDIRFDAPSGELVPRPGEKVLETFTKVEDTKGNSGEVGRLSITNLRIVWQSLNKPRINLTIGFNCINTITNRMMHTKLRGKNESLYLMTKVNGTRYEFIFIRLEPVLGVSREMVDLIAGVCKAYVSTRLYRDLRLRSAIISVTNKQLKIFPSEQIYNTINGVWNLSSDQGNLGTMFLTNVRVVWHANMNDLFNISLPYIQIRNIKVRESKFGIALVIESSEMSGGYVLGFRVDPIEKLNSVFEELSNLYAIHSENPDYGVEAYLSNSFQEAGLAGSPGSNGLELGNNGTDSMIGNGTVLGGGGVATAALAISGQMMNVANRDPTKTESGVVTGEVDNYEEIVDESGDSGDGTGTKGHGGDGRSNCYGDPVAAYLAEGESNDKQSKGPGNGNGNGTDGNGGGGGGLDWVYVPQLGLAIEKIKEGFTMESLWEVVEN